MRPVGISDGVHRTSELSRNQSDSGVKNSPKCFTLKIRLKWPSEHMYTLHTENNHVNRLATDLATQRLASRQHCGSSKTFEIYSIAISEFVSQHISHLITGMFQ